MVSRRPADPGHDMSMTIAVHGRRDHLPDARASSTSTGLSSLLQRPLPPGSKHAHVGSLKRNVLSLQIAGLGSLPSASARNQFPSQWIRNECLLPPAVSALDSFDLRSIATKATQIRMHSIAPNAMEPPYSMAPPVHVAKKWIKSHECFPYKPAFNIVPGFVQMVPALVTVSRACLFINTFSDCPNLGPFHAPSFTRDTWKCFKQSSTVTADVPALVSSPPVFGHHKNYAGLSMCTQEYNAHQHVEHSYDMLTNFKNDGIKEPAASVPATENILNNPQISLKLAITYILLLIKLFLSSQVCDPGGNGPAAEKHYLSITGQFSTYSSSVFA